MGFDPGEGVAEDELGDGEIVQPDGGNACREPGATEHSAETARINFAVDNRRRYIETGWILSTGVISTDENAGIVPSSLARWLLPQRKRTSARLQ